jgi:hypothetical protein
MNKRIRELAVQAGYMEDGFGIGHWDMPECKKFAELIIQECIDCCGSQADRKNIRKCFGLPVESNVMYPGPETIGHHSQYERKYNIPDNA